MAPSSRRRCALNEAIHTSDRWRLGKALLTVTDELMRRTRREAYQRDA